MKLIWFVVGFGLCAQLNADVVALDKPAIDVRAPAYYAHLVDRSEYVVIPVYDFARKSMGQPLTVRDRAQLDQLARILEHAVYQPASHILATTAGGPVTFYAANQQRVLTFESFGDVVRLNGDDYRIDKKGSAALTDWFKKAHSQTP